MKFESVLRYNLGVSWFWNFTENCYNEQDEQKVTHFLDTARPPNTGPLNTVPFCFPQLSRANCIYKIQYMLPGN